MAGFGPAGRTLATHSAMSEFGNRIGAARLGQVASDAVSVTLRRSLTCADTITWPVWLVEHCVRGEAGRIHGGRTLSHPLRSGPPRDSYRRWPPQPGNGGSPGITADAVRSQAPLPGQVLREPSGQPVRRCLRFRQPRRRRHSQAAKITHQRSQRPGRQRRRVTISVARGKELAGKALIQDSR
jgi:hypothetical protein